MKLPTALIGPGGSCFGSEKEKVIKRIFKLQSHPDPETSHGAFKFFVTFRNLIDKRIHRSSLKFIIEGDEGTARRASRYLCFLEDETDFAGFVREEMDKLWRKLSSSDDPNVTVRILTCFSLFRGYTSFDNSHDRLIYKLVNDPNPSISLEACRLLAVHRAPSDPVIDKLISNLSNPDPQFIIPTLYIFKREKKALSQVIAQKLVSFLDHPNVSVCLLSCSNLIRLVGLGLVVVDQTIIDKVLGLIEVARSYQTDSSSPYSISIQYLEEWRFLNSSDTRPLPLAFLRLAMILDKKWREYLCRNMKFKKFSWEQHGEVIEVVALLVRSPDAIHLNRQDFLDFIITLQKSCLRENESPKLVQIVKKISETYQALWTSLLVQKGFLEYITSEYNKEEWKEIINRAKTEFSFLRCLEGFALTNGTLKRWKLLILLSDNPDYLIPKIFQELTPTTNQKKFRKFLDVLSASKQSKHIEPKSFPCTITLDDDVDKHTNLYQQGKYYDTTLEVEEKRIQCHKIILAAGSPYFERVFAEEKEVYEVEDVDFKMFNCLVFFLYNKSVEFEDIDHAIDVLFEALNYEIKELEDLCIRFLSEQITWDSFQSLFESGRQDFPKLLVASVDWCWRNYSSKPKSLDGFFDKNWESMRKTMLEIAKDYA